MLAESTIRSLNKHAEFCQRAVALRGRPRELMVALGEADELFFRLYPHHYRALQLVRVASQFASEVHSRRDPMRRCESRVMNLLTDVIHSAITIGDLELTQDRRPETVAFSIWALTFGTRALMNTAVATTQLGITDGFEMVRDVSNLVFDSIQWQPLSTAWNYEETRLRIRKEIFSKEWAKANAA